MHGRRGFAAAAVVIGLPVVAGGLALLGGCGGSGGPGGGAGPDPDPERDGCAPYAWYADGEVPYRTSAVWTGGLFEDIAVDDGLAVLASTACGLRVMDVADPAEPTLLGAADCLKALAADLQGRLAAVAEGESGFSLHDLSDPARPVLLARVLVTGDGTASTYTDAVLLDGTRLFVAGFHNQLVSYDVSDPRAPVEKGRLAMVRPGALAVRGDRLFAGGRAVVRVGADGSLALAQELGKGSARDLAVAGARVHAVVEEGLATFDASSPDTVLLADLQQVDRARCLAVAGDLVYVGTTQTSARLHAYDFSGGGEPAEVLDVRAADFATFYSLARVDGVLLAGERWLRVIDVADPTAPVFAPAPLEPAYPQGLAVCGAHAVVADGPLAAIYPLGDGPATRPSAVYSLASTILNLTAGGRGYVYVARNANGLVVMDPAAGTTALVHAADRFGPLAASDSLLVAAYGGTLRVYTLEDPALPAFAGELEFDELVRKVAVGGRHALVSLSTSHLVLVDLADPARPAEVARDPAGLAVKDSGAVAWADSIGFDYHVDGLLRVVRPDGAGTLVTVGALSTGGEGRSLVRQGQVLYALAGGSWGGASSLQVLDLADPLHPVQAGQALSSGVALTHMVRSGEFLYVLAPGGVLRYWPDCLAVD